MRRVTAIMLLMLIPGMLAAYEMGTFNLKNPSYLETGQGEFKVQHRFRGKINDEPFDTFFGMDQGVNIGIGLRYSVLSGLELNASRFWNRKEGIIGASYAYPIPATPLRSQLDIQFFRFEEFSLQKGALGKEDGVFVLFSLQSEPLFNRISPLVNIGYDSHTEEFGAGLGLGIVIIEYLGILQRLSAVGEYFPTTGEDKDENSFAFGFRIETYDHHFDLILSRNSENGVRRLMAGTIKAEGVRFGFNIKRRI